jgi:hypothetical protein
MPNWKKVIVSGSDASLNSLNVTSGSIISGSLNVNGGITGSLLGTASFASTASYWSGSIINAQTASYVVLAQSASYWSGSIQNAISSSYALTASFALNSGGGGTSALFIQDEGITQGSASYLDFIGDSVTATVTNGTASITISGGGTAVQGASVQFSQPTAATTWSINHAINSRTPVIEVYDRNYNVIIPTGIQNPAPYQTNIFFEIAQSGYAVISTGGVLSVSGSNAILNQNIAATTWSFNHELSNLYPVFTIFDSNNDVIIPQRINVVNTGSAVIYFSTPRTGTAVASIAGPQAFATQSLSSSYAVSASYAIRATSASYSSTASYLEGYISPFPFTGSAIISGSLEVTGTLASNVFMNPQTITNNIVVPAGYNALVLGPVDMSASIQIGSGSNLTILENFTNLATTGSNNFVGNQTITGSLVVTGGVTGSLQGTASFANTATSASYALTSSFSLNVPVTASFANNATSASYALTASYLSNYIPPFPFTGSAGISGSLNVNGNIVSTGTLTAQTLVVQTITSSVDFVTGSTKFGTIIDNTHQFTGSVSVSGSVHISGSLIATSSITTPVVNSPLLQNGSQYIAQDTATTITAIVNGSQTWGFYPGGQFYPAGVIGGSSYGSNQLNVTNLGPVQLKGTLYGAQIVTSPDQETTYSYAWNFKTDGDLELPTGKSITGSLFGTASYATFALTASYATSASYAETASYAINPIISGSINNVDYIDFKTSATVTQPVAGRLSWNNTDGTLDLGMKGGNVTQQIGQETFYEIRNETTSSILNGTSLYANGVTAGSGRITAAPFVADGNTREVRYLGLATENISTGVNGFVTHFGYVRGLDTRGTDPSSIAVGDENWSVGDILYAHPTVAGKLTNVKPKHEISVAIIIIRHQSTGVLFVRPSSYGHINDIHDVNINTGSLSTGDLLIYDSGSDYWTNSKQLSGSYGLTGSLQATSFTGSLLGTASYATFALTASTAPGYTVQFTQSVAASTWSFDHNMNTRNPIVQVYDSSYKQIIPNDIVGVSVNTAEIRFDYATTGYVVMSNGGGLYVTGSTSILTQTSAATTWSFTHNLNSKYVNFEVYDSNDYVIIPAGIRAIDINTAELHFAGATAGKAVANFSGINGAPNATTASYALTATSASFASTASYLNPIQSSYVILSQVSASLNFADDDAAAAGGVPLGGLYRNGNFILIRIS